MSIRTPFTDITILDSIGSVAIDNTSASDYHKKLWTALTQFNEDYFLYIGNAGCYNCTDLATNIPDTNCNAITTPYLKLLGKPGKCSDLKAKMNSNGLKIQNYIDRGNDDLGSDSQFILKEYGPLQLKSNYDNSYNEITGNLYPQVLSTRAKLDMKLRDLYDIEGSRSIEQQYIFDGTIYSGVLLTILASALVYYTFTKL